MAVGTSYPAGFYDDNGVERLAGTLTFADSADQPTGVPASFAWVTVQSSAPTTYLTPLVLDDTMTTGGLYAWDGSAYQQVGAALT